LDGGEIDSHGDHRIAMAFAVAAQCAQGEVRIDDVANVATSFPGFDTLARAAGFALRPA
jgi:3-phosphoshikimate 1-carboxyvinyltransferase